MLDIKFIRENPEIVKQAAKDKGIDIDIEKLLELDERRRKLQTDLQEFNHLKNQASKEIPKLSPLERKQKIAEMKEVDKKAEAVKKQLQAVSSEFNSLMIRVPNIPSPQTPVGPDESFNKEIYQWGEIPKFKFKPLSHIELGLRLDILDLERGVKVSGFRGYFLKNEGALMHLGILWLALERLIKNGFTPLIPPTLVREFVLLGSGHFPFGKEEIYQIGNPHRLAEKQEGKDQKENIYLAGTSEPSLLAYYANETLEEKQLPVKFCAFSPCYRSEVGSYGKDTKGIYRIHEFMKVEQVVLCKNDLAETKKILVELEKISRGILEDLKLPYRVVINSTGDQGAGKYEMHDIETWMPSRNAYGETHSDSALTDWQARRLNIRYRDRAGKIHYVHTLNNTAIASPRILIALWENYQQEDGSIKIPKPLQKFVGKKEIKAKK